MNAQCIRSAVVFFFGMSLAMPAAGQPSSASQQPANGSGAAPVAATVPAGYVIGAEDILSIVFWRDKEMSADVVVRPDGKISLPLLNDVDAAGYTPDQLRTQLVKAASKYLEDPNATVVVKEIHSRKVFITGQVTKAGSYSLVSEMNVLQLLAHVGGLLEYADAKNIVIMRNENGQERRFTFNYKDVVKGKNLQQNIMLKPGDTVIVP